METVLNRSQQYGLSVNLVKSLWRLTQQKFVGMVISLHGVQPSQSMIYVVTKPSTATTVEQVRSLLRMSGYLSKCMPGYSSFVMATSNLDQGQTFRVEKREESQCAMGDKAEHSSGDAD